MNKGLNAASSAKEKLLYLGAGALSNNELLSLVLRTGTKDKTANELASDVLSFVSEKTEGLGFADARELSSVSGMGEGKACSIVAGLELSKRIMAKGGAKKKIRSSAEAAELLRSDVIFDKREQFIALLFDVKLSVISKEVISIGNLDTAPVHPREVFSPAIRKGAAAILVAHSHPSGDPEPSDDDIMVTKRLKEASEILGIKLLDHIILGDNCYYSLKEHGIF